MISARCSGVNILGIGLGDVQEYADKGVADDVQGIGLVRISAGEGLG